MRRLVAVLCAAWVLPSLSFGQAPPSAGQIVDVELVLAADVSQSMDYDEHTLQRKGAIEAFRQSDTVAAMLAGRRHRIAVAYMEFASDGPAEIVIPWTIIDSPEAARGFADRLAAEPVRGRQKTSLSNALSDAAELIESNGIGSDRQIIMMSGDGANAVGPPVTDARDAVVRRGIVIDGLPIMLARVREAYDIDNLDTYFERCVIGGPGAFVASLTSIQQFSDAIRMAMNPAYAASKPASPANPGQRPSFDCMVGEKAMARSQSQRN